MYKIESYFENIVLAMKNVLFIILATAHIALSASQICGDNSNFESCMEECSCGWCGIPEIAPANHSWPRPTCEYHDFNCAYNWTLSTDGKKCAGMAEMTRIIVLYVIVPCVCISIIACICVAMCICAVNRRQKKYFPIN